MNDHTDPHTLALMGAGPSARGSIEIEQARAIQQVQAAMVIAKKFPRNIDKAMRAISQTCEIYQFAEEALYGYKRGGELVSGPSIRAAEVMAQSWGNIDFGLIELSNANGQSEVEAFAHDLESNVRRSIRFFVEHARYKKGGVREELRDSRDIYELVANQGQRRVRACILAVIPSFVQSELVSRVELRLARDENGRSKPIAERIVEMVELLKTMGVSVAQIERRLGHKVQATSESELVRIRGVVRAIKDGFAKVEEFFDPIGVEDLDPTRRPAAGAGQRDGTSKPAPASEVAGTGPHVGEERPGDLALPVDDRRAKAVAAARAHDGKAQDAPQEKAPQSAKPEGAIDEAEVMRAIERATTLEALAPSREMLREFKGAPLARLTKFLADREKALSAAQAAAPAGAQKKDPQQPAAAGGDDDFRME